MLSYYRGAPLDFLNVIKLSLGIDTKDSIRITLVSSVEEGLRGDCHLSFFLSLPVSDNEVDVIYSFPWKSCPLCSNPFSNT